MNVAHSPEQAVLFHPSMPDRAASEVEALRHAAIRARDEAFVASLRTGFRSVGHALAFVGSTLRSWPERRRAYADLRALSDRELADIGLARGDIGRVFEPGFAAPRQDARRKRVRVVA